MPDETPGLLSFEAGLDELESVVRQLEAGDLPLEKSIELFESGMVLSERCRRQLLDAETKVEMLVRREGKLQPEAFRTDASRSDALRPEGRSQP